MATKRAFISFDYDNDEFLGRAIAGQAKNPDTPFEFSDQSNKQHLAGDWKEKTRKKIKGCDVVIVMCGEKTHTATGVSAEVKMAQEEKVPYFLLQGYPDKTCTKPSSASLSDKIYRWTWDNVKALVGGAR